MYIPMYKFVKLGNYMPGRNFEYVVVAVVGMIERAGGGHGSTARAQVPARAARRGELGAVKFTRKKKKKCFSVLTLCTYRYRYRYRY